MSNPMNVKIDGHVEQGNDTNQITQEQFNSIESGDTVFLKDGKTGVMKHRLSRSIYLTDKKQTTVYPEDLMPPYFLKKSKPKKETLQQQTAPTDQKQAAIKKPVKAPVDPMMLKLQSLLVRYPNYKDFILKQGATGTTTTEEIEGEILMMSV